MTLRTNRTERNDERGNMIIAVAIIMVLGMLSTAVIARTMGGLKSTRQGQDFSGALANADAGISDALFRIDQRGTASAATFCVGASSGCTVTSVPGAPGVQYVAQRVDNNTYKVYSKGLINGQPHATSATITRAFTYPFAIFTKTSLNFNGNSGNYSSSNCVGPVETVDANGNVVSPPDCYPTADVATNGQISCHGSTSPAHQQDYYKGGGTNCDNAYLLPGSYAPKDPASSCPAPANIPTTPCLPSGYNACPAVGGVLPATLLPGAYLCTQADAKTSGKTHTISFPSLFSVGSGATNNGVVELFIMPTDGTNITLSIADAVINKNGDPTKLRVYLAGGTVDPGNGMPHAGDFTGVLWAPNAVEANPSCNANWRGALVLNAFSCNGGTHLQVQYDSRMLSLTEESWSVTDYTEVPSSDVVLP